MGADLRYDARNGLARNRSRDPGHNPGDGARMGGVRAVILPCEPEQAFRTKILATTSANGTGEAHREPAIRH